MTVPRWSSPSISAEGLAPVDGGLTAEELLLASRNRGMPLEALRYDTTPAGLHYLLTHFDIPLLDSASYRLTIGERELSLGEIRSLGSETIPVTMECAGNGRARLSPRPVSTPWLDGAIGTALWTGAPFHRVLDATGIPSDTRYVVFTGADHGSEKGIEQDYQRGLSIEEAMRPEVLLAYEMDGAPLPVQHGAPLRLLVPGWYGMTSVKWLKRISFQKEPFEGFQHRAYRIRASKDDDGVPVNRIAVRSLMIPPGFPDYLTRIRIVDAGMTDIFGRAWSGNGEITRVELGVDGSWSDASLEPHVGAFAWCGWRAQWEATPGDHVLSCRATDASGATQPIEARWNYGGFSNNATQQVAVKVRS
ncbi:MAG: hypothetical protein NVSMB57_00500 [Actinomycetota bacterium]